MSVVASELFPEAGKQEIQFSVVHTAFSAVKSSKTVLATPVSTADKTVCEPLPGVDVFRDLDISVCILSSKGEKASSVCSIVIPSPCPLHFLWPILPVLPLSISSSTSCVKMLCSLHHLSQLS